MQCEHLNRHELEPRRLDTYIQTFVNRLDAYPWQQPSGGHVAVHKPLPSPMIKGHLKGHITLGTHTESVNK
jgi:hypothetical protein